MTRGKPSAVVVAVASVVLSFALPAHAQTNLPNVSDQDIRESYIYLLGRLMVTRQQQLDFQEGFRWNELVHRKPGAVDWPNPNLDVAYSEAWVATDDNSCTIVSVPRIEGRYYTVQFLNGWGETLANINQRIYPKRPSGEFAICLRGANVTLPADVARIDFPVKHSRVLLRVELGEDRDGAVALQKQFSLRTTGNPALPEVPRTPIFELENLPGIESFDAADAALDSEPDINPGLEALAGKTREVAKLAKEPAARARIENVIRTQALPEIAKAGGRIGHGTIQNGWARPGVVGEYGIDYLTRMLVNYRGLWANIKPEVLYYRGGADSTGAELNGDHVYTLTFSKDELPEKFANYFWSVIAVDSTRFRVLPNSKDRYLLNRETHPQLGSDGSLTLYFADQKPAEAPDGNWLPTPKAASYRLTFRYYGPTEGVANGTYYPPALLRKQ